MKQLLRQKFVYNKEVILMIIIYYSPYKSKNLNGWKVLLSTDYLLIRDKGRLVNKTFRYLDKSIYV